MIFGIGNDIIEVERVKNACQKESFCRKCYTEQELKLFRRFPQSLAGNFAAKEAVSKAMGCGFSSFSPSEIEILRDENGKPYVNLYGVAKQKASELQIGKIFISISNLKEYATAVSVIECQEA